MKRLLSAAALLVLVADAAVFAHVLYNRSGEPRTVTLTERELPIPYYYSYNRDDNSGMNLRLQWRTASSDAKDRYWQYDRGLLLDEQSFLDLGFNPAPGCDSLREYRGGQRDLARQAWVAFEYDGSTHAKAVAQQRRQLQEPGIKKEELEQRTHELEQLEHRDTRLYVVGVAVDRDELTAQYPGALILAATIGNRFDCQQKYKIYVSNLLTDTIHVPAEYHPLFKDIPERVGDATWSPAYRVTLAIGKLAEPWLLKVERVTDAPP
ncbi:MAG TPA: DUF4824 family protein [Gammaproteobacteria bacterium]|nr:DUF4824 family protein [Gammaproteobacteria bacterium]